MAQWKDAKLADVADIIFGQSPPSETINDFSRGLPFFQGKAEFGEVSPTPKKWCDSPLKIAESGDILISVRTPVGRTNLATTECGIGRGLAAIRSDQTKLNADYLRFMLRKAEPELTHKAQQSTSGAIGREDLASICFPLPTLTEQSRNADLLSRAEGLVRLRREAERESAEMVAGIFLEMFGDPAANTMGWATASLASLGTLARGKSRHRPRDAQELFGGIYPLIKTKNIANSVGRITGYSDTYSELGLAQSNLWPAHTLCIAITANDIKTGILEFGACLSDNVIGFLPDERVQTEFVQAWLNLLQPMIETGTLQTHKENISLKSLRNLSLPLAPLKLQLDFISKVEQIRPIQAEQSNASAEAQDAFNALLEEIFGINGNEYCD